MASEVTKVGISADSLQQVIRTWKRANDEQGTQARLTAKADEVVLRANGTAYIFRGEDAAKTFLPIFENEDVRALFTDAVQKKCYSANLHAVKEVLGLTESRPRDSKVDTAASTSTSGKSDVAKIDSAIARLRDRVIAAEKVITDSKLEITALVAKRADAVKRDEEAKKAQEKAKKAQEEAQAQALEAVTSMSDAEIEAAIAAEKAKLELFKKALQAKRQPVAA